MHSSLHIFMKQWLWTPLNWPLSFIFPPPIDSLNHRHFEVTEFAFCILPVAYYYNLRIIFFTLQISKLRHVPYQWLCNSVLILLLYHSYSHSWSAVNLSVFRMCFMLPMLWLFLIMKFLMQLALEKHLC